MVDYKELARLIAILTSDDRNGFENIREIMDLARSIGRTDDRDEYLESIANGLTAAGRYDEAVCSAFLIEDPFERSSSIQELGMGLYRAGFAPRSLCFLRLAMLDAERVELAWLKGERLCRIANAFVETGHSDEAEPIYDDAIMAARLGEDLGPQDSWDSSSVLDEISSDLARNGYVAKAGAVAAAIKVESIRQRALNGLRKIEDDLNS